MPTTQPVIDLSMSLSIANIVIGLLVLFATVATYFLAKKVFQKQSEQLEGTVELKASIVLYEKDSRININCLRRGTLPLTLSANYIKLDGREQHLLRGLLYLGQNLPHLFTHHGEKFSFLFNVSSLLKMISGTN